MLFLFSKWLYICIPTNTTVLQNWKYFAILSIKAICMNILRQLQSEFYFTFSDFRALLYSALGASSNMYFLLAQFYFIFLH